MLTERAKKLRIVLFAIDWAIVLLSFVIAYLLRRFAPALDHLAVWAREAPFPANPVPFGDYALLLFFAQPVWALLLTVSGAYRPFRTRTLFEFLWPVVKSSAGAFLFLAAFIFLSRLTAISRVFFLIFMGLATLGLMIEKTAVLGFARNARRLGRNPRRVLIVGTGPRAGAFVEKLESHPEWGIEVIGVLDDEPARVAPNLTPARLVGRLENISDTLHGQPVDEVIFVVPRARLNHMADAIRSCEIEGVPVTLSVDLFDLRIARSRISDLDGTPLLTFETIQARDWELALKRAFDVAAAGAALALFGLPCLAVALAIKITSRGPILFRQKRMGLHGRTFTMYKFRTMRDGADKELAQVEIRKEIYGSEFRTRKLRLVTPVGRWLRKLSLDEIPQFLNVLVGHMSLVGPRPVPPAQVSQYESWHRRRLSMRPGLTCLWQIKGRRNISFAEWMRLDLEYLDRWSLGLDLKILLRTIPAILSGRGAY